MERNMQLQDWLDDLCVRFLMNGPKEDLETAERICFRVEEAQWYYEDFIRPLDPTLPSMTLKRFCEEIFAHCPLLLPFSQDYRIKAFDAFLSYKKRVPVRGAIMLNEEMDKLVLVKGWKKGATWSFPRGKINKDEDDLDCAIREVYEETGFDLGEAGFVPEDRQVKSIELNMHEQQIRLFVFRGIPINTHFEPRTRKEISAIDWWQLCDLPAFRKGKIQAQQQPVYKATNFYMVAPFLIHVRKWIAEQKKQDANQQVNKTNKSVEDLVHDELISEEDQEADSNVEPTSPEEVSPATKYRSPDKLDDFNFLMNAPARAYHVQEHTQDLLKHHTGSDLLALLHSKPNTANQQPQKYLPHTSLSHDTLPTHESRSSHHLVPKSSHHCKMLPFPTFPIIEQTEDNVDYHQLPTKNQYESMIEAQKRVQTYEPNSIPGPHSHQPQHLIHPQPLPPYVQRAVFAQSPVSASPLNSSNPSHLNPASNMPYLSARQASMTSDNNKQISPKLTNHTFALLNSFKSRMHGDNPTSNLLQKPEQKSELQYSYINNPSNQIPPMKQTTKKQHEEYCGTINSPWSIPSSKISKEKSSPTPQQNHEMATQHATRDLNSFQESSNSAILGTQSQVSTDKNYYRDNVQTQYLHLQQSQHNPWAGQHEFNSAKSKLNDQDSLKQPYQFQNPRENPSETQHARKTYTGQHPVNYINHESLKNDQRNRHLFSAHQIQELPVGSSHSRQNFPIVHTSPKANGTQDPNSNLASLTQPSTLPKTSLQNYPKTLNTKSNELPRLSSGRAPPSNLAASAVELSALDPLTKKTENISIQKSVNWGANRTDSDQNIIQRSTTPSLRAAENLLKLLNPKIQPSLPLQSIPMQKNTFESSQNKQLTNNHKERSSINSLLLQAKAAHRQKSQSLFSESSAPTHSDTSRASGSSNLPEHIHNEIVYPRPDLLLQKSEQMPLSSHHGFPNGSFSRTSVTDAHPQTRGRNIVQDIPDIRRASQTISPSDKGFLLSYLDAVVAKGT